jgi:hypothetical protein
LSYDSTVVWRSASGRTARALLVFALAAGAAAQAAACGAFSGDNNGANDQKDASASDGGAAQDGSTGTNDASAAALDAGAADGGSTQALADASTPIWEGGAPTIMRAGPNGVYWVDGAIVRGILGTMPPLPFTWSPLGTSLKGLAVSETSRLYAMDDTTVKYAPGDGVTPVITTSLYNAKGVAGVAVTSTAVFILDGARGVIIRCDVFCDNGTPLPNGAFGSFSSLTTLASADVAMASHLVVAGAQGSTTEADEEAVGDDGGAATYDLVSAGVLTSGSTVNDLLIVRSGIIAVASSSGVGTFGGGSGGVSAIDKEPAVALAADPNPTSKLFYVAFATRVAVVDTSSASYTATTVARGFTKIGGIAVTASDLYVADTSAGAVYKLSR